MEWVEDDARKEEGDGGRWREKRLRASGCVWRLSHSRHTFRSPAYPDWAQRRSALSASLSECLISHSVHDHRWSHLSLPLAVPLDAHVLPLPRQRISSMTLLSNTTTDIIGQAPFLSSHYPSPTSHYPHQFPSIPPFTQLLRFRHTIYGFSLQARPGTAIPFQQTQPSPSPERKQIRFTSSISKKPTRCPLLYTSRLMIQYSIFTCLASRCLPPTSRSTSMSLLITFETQIKHYATEIDLSPRLRIQM